MIQTLQRFSHSRGAKIFLGIVALSFVSFFGGGSFFQKKHKNAVVAEIGSVAISSHELSAKVQEQAKIIMSQATQPISQEDLLRAGLPRQVLEQLVQITLLNLEATRLGLTVTDEDLRKRIHSLKAFQDAAGSFDHARFTQILRANGFSEDTFLENVREEIIRGQLSDAVMAGVHLPSEMVAPLFDLQYQHRQASLLLISPKDMSPPSPPNTKTLEAFYKKHAQAFTTPELRTFTALVLDPTLIAKTISVTEEEVKTAYANGAHSEPLETVRASIIADLQKEGAVEQLYKTTQELDDKIAGGATFEELAKQTKGVTLTTLDFVSSAGLSRGETPSSQLPKDGDFSQELLQSAFTLAAGVDSPFIQAKNGSYYAVRVDKVVPRVLQPFAKKQAFALKVWQEAEQFKAAQAKAQELARAFNQGTQKLQGLTPLPSLSLSEPSPSIPNAIKDLAFTLHLNQAGVALLPEGVAIVCLTNITPPDAENREKSLASFRDILLTQYKTDTLMAYVNALRVRYPVKINTDALQALYTKTDASS